MKRICLLLLVSVLLCGCGQQTVYETVNDTDAVPVMAPNYKIQVQLPEETASPVMESEGEILYRCENYSVMVLRLEGGDLDRTLREVTGMDPSGLTVLKTQRDGFPCYRLAWSAAGEQTQQVCRCIIMDDGSNHHAVTVMADYEKADSLDAQWTHVLNSVCLLSTG